MDYKNAGVDIEAGYESVELMKKYVKADSVDFPVRSPWKQSRGWRSRYFYPAQTDVEQK